MDRLTTSGTIALVALLLSALAFGQDAKKESPLEGWTVVGGPWKKEQGGISCSGVGGGRLRWEGEAKRAVSLEFTLTVRRWFAHPYYVGIIWAAGEAGAYGEIRNAAVVTSDNKLIIKDPGGEKSNILCPVPLGKPLRVRANISRKGIQIAVGKAKAQVVLPCDRIGHIFLWAHGGEAVFSKVKIKAK